MNNFNIERVARQMQLNDIMKDLGSERFEKNALRQAKIGGYGETTAGTNAMNNAIAGFIQKLDEYMFNHTSTKGRNPTLVNKIAEKSAEDDLVYRVNPSVMARVTFKGVMRSLIRPEDKRITITTVATLIGKDLEFAMKSTILDLHYVALRDEKMEMLRRQGLLGDADEIRRVMEELADSLDVCGDAWTNHELIEVGSALLLILAQSPVQLKIEGFGDEKQEFTFSDFFLEDLEHTVLYTGQHKSRKTFRVSEQGIKWLLENEEYIKGFAFNFLPMVLQPMDWTYEEGYGFRGGYYEQSLYEQYPLMKGVPKTTLNNLYDEKPEGFDTLMHALNLAQQTPFKINKTVFDAVEWVDKEQIVLDRKGIPAYQNGWVVMFGSEDKVERYFEIKKQLMLDENNNYTEDSRNMLDEFIMTVVAGSDLMDIKSTRKHFRKLVEKAKRFNQAEKSKKLMVTNILHEAERFLEEDLYFCYNADFRGRIYPIAGLFQPQGSDTAKGMLEFARGKQAADEGTIDAIAFQIANSFGVDKVSIADRVKWTNENSSKILECAGDFIKYRFWLEADKPFLFLLGCLEWQKVKAAEMLGDPLNFITTLPIAFDGSCNGIQHFSAMLRDEDGAVHVNLVPSDVPADVYKVVSDDALASAKGINRKWHKFVVSLNEELGNKLFDRKVSKRATMTTPYGVSEGSAGDYVLEEVDKFIMHLAMTETGRKEVRKIMKKLIWKSILSNVGAPVFAKVHMQKIAEAMALEGKGLKWFTPTGLPVLQMVMAKETKMRRAKVTVLGRSVDRHYPIDSRTINFKEQANGIAPNFVHSFDSAHLQKTVIAARKEGMEDFLLIHDSFAVDANSAARFNHIIREQFVDIYLGRDYLREFHEECERQLDGMSLVDPETCELLKPMEIGDFDVRQVLDSEYFFS